MPRKSRLARTNGISASASSAICQLPRNSVVLADGSLPVLRPPETVVAQIAGRRTRRPCDDEFRRCSARATDLLGSGSAHRIALTSSQTRTHRNFSVPSVSSAALEVISGGCGRGE